MKKSYSLDTLLVLGGEKNHSRTDLACDRYFNGPDTIEVIIVSGGNIVKETAKPEWLDMKEYLISKKIPSKKIKSEPKAVDTLTNIVYSWQILEDLEAYQFGLITDGFHISRAKWIAERVLGEKYTVIPSANYITGTWKENEVEIVTKKLLEYDLDRIHKVKSGNREAFIEYMDSNFGLYLPLLKFRTFKKLKWGSRFLLK